jgi:hypothetical protein
MAEAIYQLATVSLRALAASLRSGPLSLGLSRHTVAQVAGASADEILGYLQRLKAIVETRGRSTDPAQIIDLVLSGPEIPGVATSDTIATVRTLIAEATREVVLVGYAVHNAKPIFEPLASRMTAQTELRVIFCLDIPRKHGDTSLESEIVRRFAKEFREKHWPWLFSPSCTTTHALFLTTLCSAQACMPSASLPIGAKRSSLRRISLKLLG